MWDRGQSPLLQFVKHSAGDSFIPNSVSGTRLRGTLRRAAPTGVNGAGAGVVALGGQRTASGYRPVADEEPGVAVPVSTVSDK
jgi:hypothetical protein